MIEWTVGKILALVAAFLACFSLGYSTGDFVGGLLDRWEPKEKKKKTPKKSLENRQNGNSEGGESDKS